MPHIFFERLEERRSTQSILGNIPANGLMGSSSFAPSASSGISGPYGFPLSMQGPQRSFEPIIYCYLVGPPIQPEPPFEPPYGPGIEIGPGIRKIFESPKLPSWGIPWSIPIQIPWLNPTYTSPSWNFLNNWTSPIQNNWQTPYNYSPSWNSTGNWTSPITNYPQTPSIPTYPWNTYMDKLSKLNNVRKDLLAFFREKGVLSDKQRQRLLSTPFEKA